MASSFPLPCLNLPGRLLHFKLSHTIVMCFSEQSALYRKRIEKYFTMPPADCKGSFCKDRFASGYFRGVAASPPESSFELRRSIIEITRSASAWFIFDSYSTDSPQLTGASQCSNASVNKCQWKLMLFWHQLLNLSCQPTVNQLPTNCQPLI